VSDEVKRYSIMLDNFLHDESMLPAYDTLPGDLRGREVVVLASDYDALASQLAELRERHEKLRKAGQGFLDICGSIKATDDAGIRAEITNRVSALRALDAALAAEEG